MRCPFCGAVHNRVVDSRVAREGRAVRRRRHCGTCDERFTTYELVEAVMADVDKRDGQVEPFDPDKLIRSIRLAVKKRPVSMEQLTAFVARLERRISASHQKATTSRELGEAVMAFLREVDPVAYVRYASVYRSFSTIDQFMRELATFEQAAGEQPSLDLTDGEDEA